MPGQRAAGLLHFSTFLESSEIDGAKANSLNELGHERLGFAVIARNEHHPPPGFNFRFGKSLHADVIECLYNSGAWDKLGENLTGNPSAEIDGLQTVGGQRIGRVFAFR